MNNRNGKLAIVLAVLKSDTTEIIYHAALRVVNEERFLSFLQRCMECRSGLSMRILSVRLSVRPFVRWKLSVKRVDSDKMQERFVQIFTPYERSCNLVFWEEEWLVGGDPFYLIFWVNRSPLERNRDFKPISARSASAVTPSEKSSANTDRKSTTLFLMSLR